MESSNQEGEKKKSLMPKIKPKPSVKMKKEAAKPLSEAPEKNNLDTASLQSSDVKAPPKSLPKSKMPPTEIAKYPALDGLSHEDDLRSAPAAGTKATVTSPPLKTELPVPYEKFTPPQKAAPSDEGQATMVPGSPASPRTDTPHKNGNQFVVKSPGNIQSPAGHPQGGVSVTVSQPSDKVSEQHEGASAKGEGVSAKVEGAHAKAKEPFVKGEGTYATVKEPFAKGEVASITSDGQSNKIPVSIPIFKDTTKGIPLVAPKGSKTYTPGVASQVSISTPQTSYIEERHVPCHCCCGKFRDNALEATERFTGHGSFNSPIGVLAAPLAQPAVISAGSSPLSQPSSGNFGYFLTWGPIHLLGAEKPHNLADEKPAGDQNLQEPTRVAVSSAATELRDEPKKVEVARSKQNFSKLDKTAVGYSPWMEVEQQFNTIRSEPHLIPPVSAANIPSKRNKQKYGVEGYSRYNPRYSDAAFLWHDETSGNFHSPRKSEGSKPHVPSHDKETDEFWKHIAKGKRHNQWWQQAGLATPRKSNYRSLSEMAHYFSNIEVSDQSDIISLLLSCRKLEKKIAEQQTIVDMLESDLSNAQEALKFPPEWRILSGMDPAITQITAEPFVPSPEIPLFLRGRADISAISLKKEEITASSGRKTITDPIKKDHGLPKKEIGSQPRRKSQMEKNEDS